MKAAKIKYLGAASIDEAIQHTLTNDGPKYMAGGQSMMPMMNLRLAMPGTVIEISDIPALRESRHVDGKLFVGACTTHASIEDGKVEDVARGYLQHVAGGIAYRSVRNRGTVGGSLVHSDPAADWPSALLALGAVAVLVSPEGRRNVPLAEFQTGLMETCLGEREILEGVLLPVLSDKARWGYTKFCRKNGEFSHSIGAVVIDPANGLANAVVGAASDRPRLLVRVSALLAAGMQAAEVGKPAFEDAIAKDLGEVTDHAPDSYEYHLHKTMVTRAITEALKK